MIKFMHSILIIIGISGIFLFSAACTTGGVFAKNDKSMQKSGKQSASGKEEFLYNEDRDNKAYYNEKNGQNVSLEAYKNSREYSAEDDSEDTYYQQGYASWYGREFQGRQTASGERFDMNKFTAAHKKLPFGSRIMVRNLENGESVTVTVNDRGPYHDNRILDLSYAAAKKIGIIGSGEAKVGIVVLKKENEIYGKANNGDSIEPVLGNEEDINTGNNRKALISEEISDYNTGVFSIQAGAFYSRRNAEKFQKQLEGLVDNPVVLIDDSDFYKVRIDNFRNRTEAEKVKRMLKNENISSYIMENTDENK